MKISFYKGNIRIEIKKIRERASAGYRTAVFDRRKWLIVIAVLTFVSIASWFFYFRQGLTLSYNDARSHVDVARRVVDSLQPGAAQIGSVWLPLFHVLEIPLIWNNFLWHTGIAGSIISMVAFVLGGIYVVKIGLKLKFDMRTIILILGVYILNPNLIFMQTTPMTESLLLFLAIASSYYIIDWVESYSVKSLIFSAFFTFLATLTRYDGWFYMLFAAGVIGFVSLRKKGYKFLEGNLILFGTLAGFGVALWFLWNQVIFGHALYFLNGEFSAKAQQDAIFLTGRLLTKGNLFYSVFVYFEAVKYNLGTWASILAIAGSILLITTKEYSLNTKAAIAVLFAPLFFNILSLLSGNSVLYLPELPPYTWFNDRYGLMMLPASIILIGFLANKRKIVGILAAAVILMETTSLYLGNNIITIQDGVRGASGQFLDDAGTWLTSNAKSGLIMVAASSSDSLLFRSGFNLTRFITEGAKVYWQTSIKDPTVYATWVVMHKGDLVYKNLKENQSFLNNFHLVYYDSFSYIYERNNVKLPAIRAEELP